MTKKQVIAETRNQMRLLLIPISMLKGSFQSPRLSKDAVVPRRFLSFDADVPLKEWTWHLIMTLWPSTANIWISLCKSPGGKQVLFFFTSPGLLLYSYRVFAPLVQTAWFCYTSYTVRERDLNFNPCLELTVRIFQSIHIKRIRCLKWKQVFPC